MKKLHEMINSEIKYHCANDVKCSSVKQVKSRAFYSRSRRVEVVYTYHVYPSWSDPLLSADWLDA